MENDSQHLRAGPRVAILGGGLAGLSAAAALRNTASLSSFLSKGNSLADARRRSMIRSPASGLITASTWRWDAAPD